MQDLTHVFRNFLMFCPMARGANKKDDGRRGKPSDWTEESAHKEYVKDLIININILFHVEPDPRRFFVMFLFSLYWQELMSL